jgi:hypothetical protein
MKKGVPHLARPSSKLQLDRLIYLPVSGVVVVEAGVVDVEAGVVEVDEPPVAAGFLSQPIVNTAKLQSTSNAQIFFITTPFLKNCGRIRTCRTLLHPLTN